MSNIWKEIIIEIPVSFVETAGNIANMVVPYGIYIEDYSNLEEEAMEIAHIDLIDQGLLNKDRTKAWIHVYIAPEENPAEAVSYLERQLERENIEYSISGEDSVEEDWINNWKKYFKPMPVGEKLLIRPVWEDAEDSDGRIILDLEPGLAFGTGTHETTRLCMELIEKYIKPEDRFLDVGCGSGILSVAALLLGASSAVGVDIDRLAIKTAVENAEINKLSHRFTGICGDLTQQIFGKYNIIAANIVADIIITLSEDVSVYMNPDSVYIISGIIDIREADVLEAIEDRFTVIERREEKGWIAMACTLKGMI